MKKKLIISASCILFAVIVLRMVGWIDIHLYKSELSTNQTLWSTKKGIESGNPFSYHLVLKEDDNILDELIYVDNNSPEIEIECVVNEINYSGNYFLPFIKTFKVEYKCSLTTPKSDGIRNITGGIEGDINGRIRGICSVNKVKKIVLAEIKKTVMNVLPNHIKP